MLSYTVKNIIVTLFVLRYSIPKQMRNTDFIWKWYINVHSISIHPEAKLSFSFLTLDNNVLHVISLMGSYSDVSMWLQKYNHNWILE